MGLYWWLVKVSWLGKLVSVFWWVDPYMTTGKTIALTRWTFVGKVMSLLFNILGDPIFHSGCEGKLGSALELLQGKSDLI